MVIFGGCEAHDPVEWDAVFETETEEQLHLYLWLFLITALLHDQVSARRVLLSKFTRFSTYETTSFLGVCPTFTLRICEAAKITLVASSRERDNFTFAIFDLSKY